MDKRSLPIRIKNPRRLPGWEIPAERIPVGRPGDYKPTLAGLPDGELVMAAFHQTGEQRGTDFHEVTSLWRSSDGGRTWSERQDLRDVVGREHFLTCTSDGTLLMTGGIVPADVAFDGYGSTGHSYLHRSTDGGRTWSRKRVLIEGDRRHGAPLDTHRTRSVRNVVELPDGTLLWGVSIGDRFPGNVSSVNAYMYESRDGGVTWDEDRPVKLRGYYDDLCGFFDEGFIHRCQSGKLLFWHRLNGTSPHFKILDERVSPNRSGDQVDRLIRLESLDNGLTWTHRGDFGDYGQMYPRILRLGDGRLLMTYTQRDLDWPVGLRARVSYDDGETWDLAGDQIVIEGFTPWGMPSGGGFGNTVQLEDGTLVSCYSYRGMDPEPYTPGGNDNDVHVEVVRWRLP